MVVARLVVVNGQRSPRKGRGSVVVVGHLVPPLRTHSYYRGRISAPDGSVWDMQALPDRPVRFFCLVGGLAANVGL